ncbi:MULTISPECIES: hypothetical protein [Sphingomonas]|uniref:Uncharacterized protein n=1 Tax=Sphingomonas molluscorum TaxID=418184 RepID=A0ABU8Q3C4_9SPHN|nr:hypothetical protein [Sphingomonas sp. JUb134]MBM7405668.1 hypothetical protein [Sphingomonas sp. JUb134]
MTGIYNHRCFIPLHQVVSASSVENRHGVEMLKLRQADGTTNMDLMTWERFGETPVQLIPSEPGTNLLQIFSDDGSDDGQAAEWFVEAIPLIGWALCIDGEVRPVTASGVNDGVSEPEDIGNFVEMPNGKVVSCSRWASQGSFDNIAKLLAFVWEVRGKRPAARTQEPAA